MRVLIYENFGGYDIAEGQKGGDEVRVAELLRQVIDEKVATFGTLNLFVRIGELRFLRRRGGGGRGRSERGEPCVLLQTGIGVAQRVLKPVQRCPRQRVERERCHRTKAASGGPLKYEISRLLTLRDF